MLKKAQKLEVFLDGKSVAEVVSDKITISMSRDIYRYADEGIIQTVARDDFDISIEARNCIPPGKKKGRKIKTGDTSC